MKVKVLVTYATKHGATAEIAEKIGEVLNQAGLQTDVLPVKQVGELAPYMAVVLGSAVYIGRWRKEADNFQKTHEQQLAERDVWLFSSGPTGEGDPIELQQGWRLPEAQKPVADRIQPHDFAAFHGALETDELNFIERGMIKNVKALVGVFRDLETITNWATTIAQALKQPGT